ncbi:MAG: DCC1-like thiol-disulfide oxidoreductase family protein [Verrucomicrobiota bacterium]
MAAPAVSPQARGPAAFHHRGAALLLFIDGECAFCDRWSERVRQADHAQRVRFGAKQGHTFQQVALAHPQVAHIASMVVLARRDGGREEVLVRSRAIREVIMGLREFRAFAAVLRIVPRFLADLGYRVFSALRTRLFGRLDACRVPRPDERARFVD